MWISRIIVMALGLFLGVIGVQFWFAPDRMSKAFQWEAIKIAGLTTMRADLGGLFVGLALICLIGAWAKNRAMLVAAALVLGSIVIGRLLGVAFAGWECANWMSLAIEIAGIVVLLACVHHLRISSEPTSSEPTRRTFTWSRMVALALFAIATVGGSGLLLSPTLQLWLFEGAARQLASQPNTKLLADDAMRVVIAGSSAPLPSRSRAKSCVAVFAGGKLYVVDVGPESVENLIVWGLPLSSIEGVLLTHFHSDHIGDLGELNLQSWAQGRGKPLDVYGGPGVEQVVDGFNKAYRLDQGYRTAHHTPEIMPPETWPLVSHTVQLNGDESVDETRTAVVVEDGALKITAIEVQHEPCKPAYAYRFDYKGRSVVITGDTEYYLPLAKAASGTDVLVSEAISRSMTEALQKGMASVGRDSAAKIMHDIQDYHMSPEEAADIANKANAKLLVFYHLLPAPDGFLARRLFASGVSSVRNGDWAIADDGSLYTLPVGSDEVRIGRVGR